MPDLTLSLTANQSLRVWNALKQKPLPGGASPPPETATNAEKLEWGRRHLRQVFINYILAAESQLPDAEFDTIP